MDSSFVDSVVSLFQTGKYPALSALVLAYIVRLLQSDTTLPIDLPIKWRSTLEIVLGLASGILAKEVSGLSWKAALVWGSVTALLIVTGRTTVTDILGGEPSLFVPLKKDAEVSVATSTGDAKITPLEIPLKKDAEAAKVDEASEAKKDEPPKAS